jgi:hypothetical protein
VGGSFMAWRLVRQVFMLMTVAALGVLAVAPAVASTHAPGELSRDGGGTTVHHLVLVPEAGAVAGEEDTFTATLESSGDGGDTWAPATGEPVSFAYVTDGAGFVSAVNGGPVGYMTCATDDNGQCTITVRTESPGDSVVTAAARSVSASARVG